MSKVIYIDPKWVKGTYEILFMSVEKAKATLGTENDKNWSGLHKSDMEEYPYHLDVKMNGKWSRFADFELKEWVVNEHRINFPTLIDIKSNELEEFINELERMGYNGNEPEDVFVVELSLDRLDEEMKILQESTIFPPEDISELMELWTDHAMGSPGFHYKGTKDGTFLYATTEWY